MANQNCTSSAIAAIRFSCLILNSVLHYQHACNAVEMELSNGKYSGDQQMIPVTPWIVPRLKWSAQTSPVPDRSLVLYFL